MRRIAKLAAILAVALVWSSIGVAPSNALDNTGFFDTDQPTGLSGYKLERRDDEATTQGHILGIWAAAVAFGNPVAGFTTGQEVWAVSNFNHPGGPITDDFAAVLAGTTLIVSSVCTISAPFLDAGEWFGTCLLGTVPPVSTCFDLEMGNRHTDINGTVTTRGQPFTACP